MKNVENDAEPRRLWGSIEKREDLSRCLPKPPFSFSDILGKIQPTWISLSLSLSSARFCWRCEITKDEKEERSRGVLCEDDPSGEAPCRGNPVCPAHNGFGRVLSASCRLFFRILLPFFLHSPADSLSARADKLDPEKIFSAANTLNEHHQLGKLELERKVSIYGDGFVGIWVGWNIYIFLLSVVFN